MIRKAILVVSFGTSHGDTRQRTIEQIEEDIRKAYPEYAVYRAFTSKMIIQILKQRDGIEVFTVSKAMEQMKRDGITDIVIQPTHILNGIENDFMIQEADLYKKEFTSLVFGTPLLHKTEDYWKVIDAFVKRLPELSKKEAVIGMGHGTKHYSNASYAALDYMFKDRGYKNIYIATVEAYPSLNDILKKLKEKEYDKVILIPFMIVSGDHAKNDMAGSDEDSWKVILEREGFGTTCILEGLGENPDIRKILQDHVGEALKWDRL